MILKFLKKTITKYIGIAKHIIWQLKEKPKTKQKTGCDTLYKIITRHRRALFVLFIFFSFEYFYEMVICTVKVLNIW